MVEIQQQYKNYAMQITKLRDELANLKYDYQRLQVRLTNLQEIVSNLGNFANPSEQKPDVLHNVSDNQDSDQELLNLFRMNGRPMTLAEIIAQIKLIKSDMIPLQIINERAFMIRRINKACDNGILVKIHEGNHTNYIYSLKEWL